MCFPVSWVIIGRCWKTRSTVGFTSFCLTTAVWKWARSVRIWPPVWIVQCFVVIDQFQVQSVGPNRGSDRNSASDSHSYQSMHLTLGAGTDSHAGADPACFQSRVSLCLRFLWSFVFCSRASWKCFLSASFLLFFTSFRVEWCYSK